MATSVLIVDRSQPFIDKTAEILEGAGYVALRAGDAAEARELLAYRKPQVALINARLPGDSGYHLCRYIKKEADPDLPVVLVFGRGEQGITNLIVESGADNHLVRPLKRHEVLFCIRDMLRIRRLSTQVNDLRAEIERLQHKEPDEGGDLFYPFDVFKKLLYVEIKRAKRYGQPLSALMIGLDGVDAILADQGAEVVARLRQAVSRAVRRSIRDIDLPASFRLGNILIVMPNTPENGVRAVADRIQQRLRRSAYRGDGFVLRPSLSLGATTSVAGRGLSFSEMVLGATLALREAQRAGGDRVVFA